MHRAHRIRSLLPIAAALALLPLTGDATNNAQCCNLGTSLATSIFGGGSGDEDFFTPPGTPPNLMILLENASSMLDLMSPPQPNLTSLLASSTMGTCVTTTEDASTPPFDNGWQTSGWQTSPALTDSPPWGMNAANGGGGTCAPGMAGVPNCLFSPASFYLYPLSRTSTGAFAGKIGTGGLGDSATSWSTRGAKEYTTANSACSMTFQSGSWSYNRVADVASCTTCLGTTLAGRSGYYAFVDQSTCPITGGGSGKGSVDCNKNTATPLPSVIFRGSYLNANPPKYVIARKLAKDVAKLDPQNPTYYDNFRLGLTVLDYNRAATSHRSGYLAGDGGRLVVPLGPDCSSSNPAPEDMKVARQAFIDAINDVGSSASGSARLPWVPFYNSLASQPTEVPGQLAEALYYIGQYFSNYNPTPPSPLDPYTQLFQNWGSSSNWTNSAWNETSAGDIGTSAASWVGSNQHSFCWKCQQSSVLVISDGSPKNDGNVPDGAVTASHYPAIASGGHGDFRMWGKSDFSSPVDCVAGYPSGEAGCGVDAADSSIHNLLHKTAYFLSHTDLRTETSMLGSQTVRTYVVGLGTTTPASGAAATDPKYRLLQKTAVLGQGTFVNIDPAATDSISFQAGNVLSSLVPFFQAAAANPAGSANGFSGTSTAQVQSPQNAQAFVARFRATKTPSWEGHLYRFKLWNEFAQSCAPGNAADLNGDGKCDSVFVVDRDGDPVVEDASGNFVKGRFDSAHALVAQSGNPSATPIWDAGNVLSTTGPDSRTIYTVVADTNGQFTTSSQRVELTIANVDTVSSYLSLDASYCKTLYQRMGVYGSPGWTDVTTSDGIRKCAKQVIHYIRGWDVLDENGDGCGGPDNPGGGTCSTAGQQRSWKLGDIFHSSPVLVNPPVTELICDLALDNQCVATIHGPQALSKTVQTPLAQYTASGQTIDAYEKYRQDHATRARIVLVGANDGMLHAFNAGSGTDDGTGAESWAFIPPDLLPKLKYALISHNYFVDGGVMVRDVWADGGATGTGSKDGTKQSDEFHTIAVVSERAGGTEYMALDVTNPADPKFRWMYPQPCTRDANMMGQSWSGFSPRPPPIGPVKLAVTTGGSQDPKGRGFEERWIVVLNGGYDSSLTRGRGIWMIDAWSGGLVWRFTNDEFANHVNSTGGMWPVPGGVALLDIGNSSAFGIDSDGFFDTATWADVGGQIYVARFNTPDSTKWAAARAFEEQRQTNDSQTIAHRSEFYAMPANTVDPSTGFLHTYAGSGNREKMLASGGSCGPDNVFGCFQAGCNTDVTTVYDYGSCRYSVKAHANNGVIRQDLSGAQDMTGAAGTACTDGTTITCNQVKVAFKVETNCNGWHPPGGSFHASLSCDANGTNCKSCDANGSNCTYDIQYQQSVGAAYSRTLTDPGTHNRFYGIWSYGGTSRSFTDWTSAATFDGRRFTDISYTGTCAGTSGSTCTVVDTTTSSVSSSGVVTGNSAGAYAPGWMYEYGHSSACPLGTGCDTSDWTNERTASGATVLAGCVGWNTLRPASGGTACDPATTVSRNYGYVADYMTGVPTTSCGFPSTSSIARAVAGSTNLPPTNPLQMVNLSGGHVSYSLLQIDPRTPPRGEQVGTTDDTNQMIYWLEVPRSLHACRHSDASQCE